MVLHDAATLDSWRQAAACRGSAAEVFFPETDLQVARAKAICSRCPVRAMCLQTALRNREGHGVWGGLTPPERSRLARRPARAA